MWQKAGLKYFWGDPFDSRFYITYLVSKEKVDTLLDLGCGAGVISHFANASFKIGIDSSFESLLAAKKIDSELQLIHGDVRNLPFKDEFASNILAIHIISAFMSKYDRKKTCKEIKRIASKNSKILIVGSNRRSKHFEKTLSKENRFSYPHAKEMVDAFKTDFQVNIEGFGPFSRFVMFPFKIIYKIPEKISENFMIERFLFRLLRSKKYLKDGRSYVIVCKRNLNS
jgi:ubiquinone/menaquinone biosynthesis C-methylase UbiE